MLSTRAALWLRIDPSRGTARLRIPTQTESAVNQRMPYTFSKLSSLSPEQLAAVLHHAHRCRPVPVPRELRRNGIKGVIATAQGSQFSIVPDSSMEWGSRYALRGVVELAAGGGSRIDGRVELGYAAVTAPLILALSGLSLVVAGSAWGIVVILAVGPVFLRDRALNRTVSPDTSIEAKFLVDSLAALVEQAAPRERSTR